MFRAYIDMRFCWGREAAMLKKHRFTVILGVKGGPMAPGIRTLKQSGAVGKVQGDGKPFF